jgi:hypothetical protein
MSYPFEYCAYFRTFRVERVPNSTRWRAAGHKSGMKPMVLDRIGDSETAEGMQFKLDNWARRQGCRPINPPKPTAAQMNMVGV